MFYPRLLILGVLALMVLSVQFPAVTNGHVVEPREGVLILRNGNTVKGKISPHGDGYLVAMAGGGEVRLSLDRVAYECRDMEEAFDLKASEVVPGDVSGYIRLAHWCLRENLLAHATRQYQIAHGIHPNHPVVQHLSRQLKIDRERLANASATAPQTEPPRPQPPAAGQAAAAVSPATLKAFSGGIQPLLINTCALAKCHGDRATTIYRIGRNPWRGVPTRPFTLSNLEATLQQIDRDNPRRSPLLEFARLSHGHAHKPGRPQISSKQYDLLKDWVFRAAGVGIVQPRTFQTDEPFPSPRGPDENSLEWEDEDNLIGRVQAHGVFAENGSLAATHHRVPHDTISPPSATPTRSEIPTRASDPFDPAWFNEKYSKGREAKLPIAD